MGIKFSNNASANIIRALTPTATSVSVTPDKGDLFPSITEGDYFYATLAGNNGLEIVKVINRVNDTMTIVRAQDNTTALSFDIGDLFELRIVAADFNDTFSEVNDKLEDSIEEITSRVNSALSSKAPVLHASSSTEYGSGSSEQYGHLKSHDAPDTTLPAATGHAFSPAGAAAMQEMLEGLIGDLAGVVSGNEAAQLAKDTEQDEAISAAQSSADAAQSSADALATSKAGVNAENFTAEGKSLLAGLGMPSGRYVDLTLGANSTAYTAPADGYVSSVMSGTVSGNMGFFTQIYDTSGKEVRRIGIQSGSTGYKVITQNFEIKKGYTFTLDTYGTTPNFFRFIYAEGAE